MNWNLFRNIVLILLLGLPLRTAHSQSQHEMNAEARESFQKADAELNKVYKKVLATLDKQGQAKLKAVQRAWITLRDAESDFRADDEARGGSMEPMIFSAVAAELTRTRTRQLQQMLKSSN